MISVIVPIYNVEEYLDECLTSITRQTYDNLEIILVNDGATDGSGDICERWKAKDSRIQVIHQENGGLSKARNRGLGVAKGEYISFVDSDDFIHPQMYERMLNALEKTNADMAICREYAFRDGEKIDADQIYEDGPVAIENQEQLLLHFCDEFSGLVTWAWNKLYRKPLLDNLLFEPDTIQEDILFSVLVASRVTKVARLDERLYYYRQRQSSIMNCPDPERLFRCTLIAEREFNLLWQVMDKKWHEKVYHKILGKIADYAAKSYREKETHLQDIEAVYRRMYDNVKLEKKFKFLLVRYFPAIYYRLKNR